MKNKELPKLICLIGPDGAGKTTQAMLLIKKLKEIGYKYEYKWIRFLHFISLPVLALARLMGLTEIQTLPDGKKIGYHYFYKSKLISTLYPLTLFLDMLLAIIFKIYIPIKIQKKRFVCDRFIYDTLVDLMIDLKNPEFINSKVAKIFLKLIPRDCLTILLIAPYEKIKERRIDLKFDKSLRKRVEMYMKLKKKFPQIIVVDASLDIKSVHKEIWNIVVNSHGTSKAPL